MKKLTMALVIGALGLLLAMPQPTMAGVQFGLKAGGNLATFTGSDVQNLDGLVKNKVGFVGGVFVAFNLGSVFTIQIEGLYTMKGATAQYTDIDTTVVEKIYGDYVEIPLLFKVRIPTPLVSPFIFAGPSVGFKLHEKLVVDGQTQTLDQRMLKNNDYGAIFGGGLNIGSHFQIDARYSLGLQKIIAVTEGTAPNLKNGVWSATIGIAF